MFCEPVWHAGSDGKHLCVCSEVVTCCCDVLQCVVYVVLQCVVHVVLQCDACVGSVHEVHGLINDGRITPPQKWVI